MKTFPDIFLSIYKVKRIIFLLLLKMNIILLTNCLIILFLVTMSINCIKKYFDMNLYSQL